MKLLWVTGAALFIVGIGFCVGEGVEPPRQISTFSLAVMAMGIGWMLLARGLPRKTE